MSLSAAARNKLPTYLDILARLLIGVGLLTLAYLLFPVTKQEFEYQLKSQSSIQPADLAPSNKQFSLLINKLYLTSPIIKDVDPFDSTQYQEALSHGIAHAKGASLPGEGGNIFLFAHSSSNLGLATYYNSVFYLIHKLQEGDMIDLWYQNKPYHYYVTSIEIISPDDLSPLDSTSHEQLTLMTCWPPGTTLRRLVVIAKPSQD